jgi:hypothetical protein
VKRILTRQKSHRPKGAALVAADNQPKWWRTGLWRPRIAAEECGEMLREGDLVLFSGKDVAARITQSLVASIYQHVGVVVRCGTGELTVFESTPDGVVLVPPARVELAVS